MVPVKYSTCLCLSLQSTLDSAIRYCESVNGSRSNTYWPISRAGNKKWYHECSLAGSNPAHTMKKSCFSCIEKVFFSVYSILHHLLQLLLLKKWPWPGVWQCFSPVPLTGYVWSFIFWQHLLEFSAEDQSCLSEMVLWTTSIKYVLI